MWQLSNTLLFLGYHVLTKQDTITRKRKPDFCVFFSTCHWLVKRQGTKKEHAYSKYSLSHHYNRRDNKNIYFKLLILMIFCSMVKQDLTSFFPSIFFVFFSGCSGCCSLHRRSKFRNGIVWSCWRHIFQWYLGKGESSDFLQGLCSFSAALIVMYLSP